MSARSIWGWVADAGPYEVISFALRMEQGALRRYTRMAAQAESRLTAPSSAIWPRRSASTRGCSAAGAPGPDAPGETAAHADFPRRGGRLPA